MPTVRTMRAVEAEGYGSLSRVHGLSQVFARARRLRSGRFFGLGLLLLLPTSPEAFAAEGSRYFAITVVDEQTGRGVPLVELTTTNSIRYYTDSNGIVALDEPGLMGQKVFFTVKSHGYEFAKDGFGFPGKPLEVTPGGSATLKIKRINIAERLYRVTGQGIYRDTVLLGRQPPLREPVLNGQVMGSDSVQHIIYGGRNFWFWGDTGRPSYPLGNFFTTGATSALPGKGALDPEVGVDLSYFVDETGFAKKMTPMPGSNPVWIDALVTLPDETGREDLYCAFAKVTQAMEAIERGVLKYDDAKQVFAKVTQFDLKNPVRPAGHPFRHPDEGMEYIYFAQPFPFTRVRAEVKSYLDQGAYEVYSCLREGTRVDSRQVDRQADGSIRYAWKKNTPALDPKEEGEYIKAGLLKPEEALLLLRDSGTGKAVTAHAGSVYWNEYRKRWITIRCEVFGTSMLGETWYAEGDTPLGPWVYARKIVTHDKYSFYNPKHHPVFDRDGGRIIYFEGTYTFTFSGNTEATPRYDYNQMMYKLNLDDPRLVLPVPLYEVEEQGVRVLRAADRLPAAGGRYRIAFFAPDRSAPNTIPVYEQGTPEAGCRLTVGDAKAKPADGLKACFHALPADAKDPPATTVLLFAFTDSKGGTVYGTEESPAPAGFTRSDRPLCRVWRNPSKLEWQVR